MFIYSLALLSIRATSITEWDECSRYIKDRAEAELASSSKLRLEMYHALQQTANDLEAQKQATEFAFRKRMHMVKRARDELEFQKATVCHVVFVVHITCYSL